MADTAGTSPLDIPTFDHRNTALPGLVAWAVATWGGRPALVDPGDHTGGRVTLSYTELGRRVDDVARGLAASGVVPGDTVAVWAPNCWQWVAAALGAARAGAVLVPVNTRFKGVEAAFVLAKARVKVLFIVDGFLGTDYSGSLTGHDLPHLGVVVDLVTGLDGLVARGSGSDRDHLQAEVERRSAAVTTNDIGAIMFTSGTTGHPKGVLVRGGAVIRAFFGWAETLGVRAGDPYLLVNPYFHAFGFNSGIVVCLMAGACNIPVAVYDPAEVLAIIEQERIAVFPGPPALFQGMLNHPDLDRYDISSLRACLTGAATIPTEMVVAMRDRLGFETIVTAYGMTETSGIAAHTRPGDPPAVIATTSGCAIPDVELRVADDTGAEVPRGSEGELLVRGYVVTPGYLDEPEQTAEAIDAEGWLHTGDIAVMDSAGYIDITDRKKDMFIVGGFNAYPAEIERVLVEHPLVGLVAVIGVPDSRLGEVGAAFVVPSPEGAPDEAELIAWCRERMANYKVPRHVWLVDDLPLTASNKVRKPDLRDLATDRLSRPGPPMTTHPPPSRSFEPDGSSTVELSTGQMAHAASIDQSHRLERRFNEVRPGVWCLVGNGLSNQIFIEGPDGIIAIDTGESVEEMNAALDELRTVTDRPVVAVLYTHFHYVAGTAAVLAVAGDRPVPVFGHARIEPNRARTASEIAPAYGRGIVEQFGLALPADGPDGLVNVGLGLFFRNPSHAPFTPGFVPPTRTFDGPCTISVAGLDVHVTPAPSDADDSVTYWFPALSVAVNNLVWPALFNVFAIRGEEYRDPRLLLAGLDHLLSLGAEHLVGAHGPPISGAADIAARVTRYRDAIQFLWDQTVRLTNQGLTGSEIAHAVRLPDHCDADHLTSEFYGVAEHHVRQIRNGLFGFFDGDEAQLFPLPPADRANRMVDGFGGRDAVRHLAITSIEDDDLRWALELGSWLVHSDGAEPADRALLARALRTVAQRTSAANIRNWCLTRARELDGTIDGARHRRHRLHRGQVTADPIASVKVLRVLLDPVAAAGVDTRIAWRFDGAGTTGIHVRNSIAVTDDASQADVTLHCDPATWAAIVAGGDPLSEGIATGKVRIEGDIEMATRALRCFELIGLRS